MKELLSSHIDIAKTIKKQKVPFLDFSREYEDLEEELNAASRRVLESAWYILGNELAGFEKEFADYSGVKYAVGVGSGLDALTLVLNAWGVGEGDEVIMAANTYIATAFAATQNKATPVFVDIDADTFNIDVNKIEEVITERTKVILPTHLYGQMADMAPIEFLAKKYNLKVLQDAAQAHGAEYKTKRCGQHVDAVAYSFYPTKNLSCYGDGGMITTDDQELYETLLHLRNNGSKRKFYYDYHGFNSRLDEIQAAFLSVKLKKLDEWSERRRQIAEIYNKGLEGIEGLILPSTLKHNLHVWHVYCVRVMNGRRSELIKYFDDLGIGYNVHYPKPPHLQKCYEDLGYKEGSFPVTEDTCEEILSLPLYPYHSDQEILFVIDSIREFFDG